MYGPFSKAFRVEIKVVAGEINPGGVNCKSGETRETENAAGKWTNKFVWK